LGRGHARRHGSARSHYVAEASARAPGQLDHPVAPTTAILFVSILVAGIVYAGLNIYLEVRDAGVITESWLPFIRLGIALLIALGFEFVNGFHDTANAVATVIYTHSLAPNVAVLRSGLWNFIGVMVSIGAVAFVIISLLPVELILQVGSHAGFAMVFALLFAAFIWNLGTWLAWPSGFLFAYLDRLHCRRRHRKCLDAGPRRHRGRRLESGCQCRPCAPALADHWLHLRRAAAAHLEISRA